MGKIRIVVGLVCAATLAGCGSIKQTGIQVPVETLKPEFSAQTSIGLADALRDYQLRYTIDGHEHLVDKAEITRDGSTLNPTLSYVAPQPAPPNAPVSAIWTAAFISGRATSESSPVLVPDPPYDLDVEGVYFYINGKTVLGDLASGKPDEETEHFLKFDFPAGAPVEVRAVVANNVGHVALAKVRLRFPNAPAQEEDLPQALGPGDATIVIFKPVKLARGKGVMVVDLGDEPHPKDADPKNDLYKTLVAVRGR